jgi:1D-myo-inositol-tetrakisphosphate 5-kinase/inositol-polyphosphate multikinase
VLENITANYRKFNVLDVKLGARLWADDAPQAKREKMDNEANATTSRALGIRIAGMRIYTGQDSTEPREVDADDGVDQDPFGQIDPTGGGYRIYDKHYGRSLTADTVHKGFEKFFRVPAGKAPDADIAKVLRAFLTDLEGLRSVLESEECRIYSSSLLFVYEGDVEALREAIRLKENPPNFDHSDGVAPSPQPTLPDEIVSTDKRAMRPTREALTDLVTPSSEPLLLDGAKTSHEAEEASAEEASADAADAADDKDSDGASPPLRIQALKLIDFAHAQWTKGQGPDKNLLYGINNVIKILHEIINR